jgi:squalene-associated FAD-dependent desaturase
MTVHVIGAGLAGLAASVRLAAKNERVILYESSPQAGGRCRSFVDKTLGRVIDNGNHLLLSGNGSTLDYLDLIGARDGLIGHAEARFPFHDLRNGRRWTIRINEGRLPIWIMDPNNRVPDSRASHYLAAIKLATASEAKTVAECLQSPNVLWDRFWDPMATAILNTPADIASAKLLWAAMKESFSRGGKSCRPLIARESLAAALVDPALTFLVQGRADLYFSQRLRAMDVDRYVKTLHFHDLAVALDPGDQVILAVPPSQAKELVPTIDVPHESHAIVNAHFKLPMPARLPGRSMLMGLVGGAAQWLFLRDQMASLTVSAADKLAEQPSDVIAEILWSETARALGHPDEAMPPYRIIKEKRATFSQTPDAIAKRPSVNTRWPNLHLAGDWTDTGLPATIEGAIRSGNKAADRVLETQNYMSSR